MSSTVRRAMSGRDRPCSRDLRRARWRAWISESRPNAASSQVSQLSVRDKAGRARRTEQESRVALDSALLLEVARVERDEVLVLVVRLEDVNVGFEDPVRGIFGQRLLEETKDEDEVREEAEKVGEGSARE